MSWGVDNLPYGVFSRRGERPRVGVRYGDRVLDLATALHDEVFAAPTLNPFMARGRTAWHDTRTLIANKLLDAPRSPAPRLIALDQVNSSTCRGVRGGRAWLNSSILAWSRPPIFGRMFRPGTEGLLPNWRHLPVGYHGRSGTVGGLGAPRCDRPHGQLRGRGAVRAVRASSTSRPSWVSWSACRPRLGSPGPGPSRTTCSG